MKFIITFLLTSIFSFAIGAYFDWWSVAIAAFIVATFIPQKPFKAWLSGFLGVFFLWGGLSFFINQNNQGLLATKVANILPLGGNVYLLIVFTAFIGGLIAGFAALSGSYLRAKR